MHETSADPLAEFRDVNTAGTECLARQAAAQGVRRFVFMSTVGVNGSTSGDRSFTEADEPCPHNAYSQSKWEAENILRAISADTGMEVVILRAPLVYGPGNPGNFLALLQIVAKGLPLPFASVRNRRSLLYVGNLADALRTCAVHPAANGETFLVSAGEDVSTPDLIRCIASSLAVSARLFPFSPTLLSLMGRITGKAGMMNSLLGSLTVDNKKIRTLLGWIPPFSMSVGLRNTIEFYKHSLNR
jgi:nucleoside-diphosphate-sugar epimerase